MLKKGIDFDFIVNTRVNKYFVIDLFNKKQNVKIKNPLRSALHNATTENIHNIYNNNVYYFKDFSSAKNNPDTDSTQPLVSNIIDKYSENDEEKDSKIKYNEDIWFEDEIFDEFVDTDTYDNLCFICPENKFLVD